MQRISLIIPCYRDAATLGRAIESVVAQTRPVDEIIVVNDCSPETLEIEKVLKAYPQVVYVKNPINAGLAATRNNGIAVATGDVVAFLDADDELHPQKIEFQLGALRENSVVTCNVHKVSNAKNRGPLPTYTHVPSVRVVIRPGSILFRNSLTGAALMAPKKLIEKLGGFDKNFRSCEDFDLWFRILEEGITVYDIQLPLYIYFYNESGLSKNHLNISYWELEALKGHFSRSNRNPFDSFLDSCVWAFWMLKHLARCEISRNDELRLRTAENIRLLSSRPILVWLLRIIEALHIFKLYAYLNKRLPWQKY